MTALVVVVVVVHVIEHRTDRAHCAVFSTTYKPSFLEHYTYHNFNYNNYYCYFNEYFKDSAIVAFTIARRALQMQQVALQALLLLRLHYKPKIIALTSTNTQIPILHYDYCITMANLIATTTCIRLIGPSVRLTIGLSAASMANS